MVVKNLRFGAKIATHVIDDLGWGRGDPRLLSASHQLGLREQSCQDDRGQKFVGMKTARVSNEVRDGHEISCRS
jgi:hypothetical protein